RALKAGEARHEEDASATARGEPGRDEGGEREDTVAVHRHALQFLLERDVEEFADGRVASVVDQEADLAAAERLLDARADGGGAEIEGQGVHSDSVAASQEGGLGLEGLGAPGDEEQIEALLREGVGEGAPDALGGARDDRERSVAVMELRVQDHRRPPSSSGHLPTGRSGVKHGDATLAREHLSARLRMLASPVRAMPVPPIERNGMSRVW